MVLAWDKGTFLRKMAVHQREASSALTTLQEMSRVYSAKERADLGINLFGGSLNVGKMRGGSSYFNLARQFKALDVMSHGRAG